MMACAVLGNFLAGWLATVVGYRRGIAFMLLGFFLSFLGAYSVPRGYDALIAWLALIGLFSGVFGLFTMYLPPLFPTLLRTTGAGFCYNVGRIAAAFGTVFFGLFSQVGDFRIALLYAGFLLPVAMIFAWVLPDLTSG
jgi:MFS family permease